MLSITKTYLKLPDAYEKKVFNFFLKKYLFKVSNDIIFSGFSVHS